MADKNPAKDSAGDAGTTITENGRQLRAQLAAAQLYVCTDARRGQGDFAAFVDAAFAGGVDIIQFRDKTIDAAEELEHFAILAAAARRHGKLFSANDRADISSLAAAPVFHAGQTDLPVRATRALLGPDPAVGLSTHNPDQVDAALATEGLDYFCTGPVWETPTKPGRPAAGLQLVAYAAQQTHERGVDCPWFAIGGIGMDTVARVVEAGAKRVVVVRAVTKATDPAAAAAALKAELPPIGSLD
ncbi:thiamine phosphate synthase [Arthrobacter castelli]|uniref:thiamine phosphate synthase n=1 Tax=Arthrobacter castelli TaxID=271431 RepID=UPI0004289358|nr:thiamine phosphate synthase [Arthrobacter castelli]